MKNIKIALNLSRRSPLIFIAVFWLVAFDSHAQLNVTVSMAFDLKSTNELSSTNSFWFEGVLSQAVGVAADPSNCGPVIATSPLAVSLEANRGYFVQYDGIFCDAQVIFGGMPSCSRLYWDGVYAPDNIVYLPSEWCCSFHLSVVVSQLRGTVKFDPVCDPDFPSIPADGKTTVSAYLSNPVAWLTNHPTWSIEGNALGCTLVVTNYNPIITAGTNIGTITVRATDSDGCYLEGNLDLYDPDSGSGCSSGSCSSSSGPAGGGSSASSSSPSLLQSSGTGGAAGGSSAMGGSSSSFQSSPFGSGSFGLNAIDLRLGVGQSAEGHPSGFIRLSQSATTTNIHFPAGLQFNYKRDDVVVIRDTDGYLRQIRSPQGLVDIDPNDFTEASYRIRFFASSNVGPRGATFSVSGSPLVTWTLSSSNYLDDSFLRIVETPASGSSRTNNIIWDTDDTVGWKLIRPDGTTRLTGLFEGGGARREIQEIRTAGGDIVGYSEKTFETFSFGERLTSEIKGLGSSSLTNSYSYNGYGQLQQTVHENGAWEVYEYDSKGRVSKQYSAYGNQAPTSSASLCRLVEYDYSTSVVSGSGDDGLFQPNTPRKTTESLLGNIISVRYTAITNFLRRDIVCVTGTNWDSPGNLVTTNQNYDGGIFYDRIKSVDHPDGTFAFYEYATSLLTTNRYLTNTVWSGIAGAQRTNVVDGTKTVTITGPVGQMISRTVYDAASIANGSPIIISSETYSDYDQWDRPQKVTYLDGTFDYTVYNSCCGQQIVTNREGTVTMYVYDDLKRLSSITVNGVTVQYSYDPLNNLTTTTRTGTDSSTVSSSSSFDIAGRLVSSTNSVNNVTTFSKTAFPIVRTTTLPNSGTRVESYARDGTLLSVTGTAAHPVRYTNGIVSDGGVHRFYSGEVKLDANGANTGETITHFHDLAGRVYKTSYGDGAATLYYFNPRGQLTNQIDPDGVSTIYSYNAKGEPEYTVLDMDRNGQLTNGVDRITRRISYVTNENSLNIQKTLTYVWNTIDSDTSVLASATLHTLDGLQTWNSNWGLTNFTGIGYIGGHRYITNMAPDGSYSVSDYRNGRLLSMTRKDNAGGTLAQLGYSYDPHGRQNAVTNSPVGATTYTFDNADRVLSITTPSPGGGGSAQTSSTVYNSLGQVATNLLSDGKSLISEYFLTGELKKEYGAREYPVEYSYDAQGRMKTMKTWKNFAGNSGTATTTWNYDGYRGFLTNKVYADGQGPAYTYTAGGRLTTRTWARGYSTTYNLDNAGAVTNVTYSDPTGTPGVTTTTDRVGRPVKIVQGSNTLSYSYADSGALLCETNLAGMLNGWSVNSAYDSFNRRVSNSVIQNGVKALATNSYDAASRLAYISDGTNNATYAYLPNSSLVSSIVFKSNTTVRLTTAKGYDNLYRLTVISNVPAADTATVFSYQYNDANQRKAVTNADGSYWLYGYDQLGQVTWGKKYFSDGIPAPGQQFEYSFDDIGNRKYAGEGGNEWGSGLRYQNYTVNNLNQYTQRTVPNKVDVIGSANPTSTVTVNSTPAYRHGDYFRGEVKLGTTGYPQQAALSTVAVLPNGTNKDIVTTNTGTMFRPLTPEIFRYDVDGNLTNDGHWILTWDAENRLIALDPVSTLVPDTSKQSLRFAYDHQSRRISKIVSNWTGSAWSLSYSTKFIYDGWNLLAEINATNNAVIRAYLWGIDASGTRQGAGGVGGLLTSRDSSGSATTNCFFAYDGNHNARSLIDAKAGTTAAEYEYDPFGDVLKANGSSANVNPIHFSTKYQDLETCWSYYGYRYLARGTWLNRDPLGDEAFKRMPSPYTSKYPKEQNKNFLVSSVVGVAHRKSANKDILNLYGIAFNDPIDQYDLIGLDINRVDQVTFKACVCDCGPDVTQVVASTLSSITSSFQSVGTTQQLGACVGLFMPPYALDSWDMNSVLSFPQRHPAGSFCAACNGKLTYSGGCYDASDINYIMFGHMFSLCDSAFPGMFPQRDVGTIIANGKILRGYPVGCSAAFGVYGYAGGSVSCNGSGLCRPSTKAATFNPSGNNWRWDGINK